MPPDTLTMLVLSPGSATLATATATMASARLTLTLSARWPTVVPEESSPVLTTATDVSLATEPWDRLCWAFLRLNKEIFQAENINGTFYDNLFFLLLSDRESSLAPTIHVPKKSLKRVHLY